MFITIDIILKEFSSVLNIIKTLEVPWNIFFKQISLYKKNACHH